MVAIFSTFLSCALGVSVGFLYACLPPQGLPAPDLCAGLHPLYPQLLAQCIGALLRGLNLLGCFILKENEGLPMPVFFGLSTATFEDLSKISDVVTDVFSSSCVGFSSSFLKPNHERNPPHHIRSLDLITEGLSFFVATVFVGAFFVAFLTFFSAGFFVVFFFFSAFTFFVVALGILFIFLN